MDPDGVCSAHEHEQLPLLTLVPELVVVVMLVMLSLELDLEVGGSGVGGSSVGLDLPEDLHKPGVPRTAGLTTAFLRKSM